MNTIPLIFNERQINRTVVGGKFFPAEVKLHLGVIILNGKGSQFRELILSKLSEAGFEQVISIEKSRGSYSVDELARKYPSIKFIIPLEKATEGELINLGMSEINCDYVLVLRDSFNFEDEIISPRVLEKIIGQKNLCTSPRLTNGSVTNLPVIFSPSVNGSTFAISSSGGLSDGIPTLYAFDNVGIYDRKKFIQLGGFDYTITQSHWQTADFFMRGWLWGHKTKISTLYTLDYETDFPAENVTADFSYTRFYLKNLLPRFDEDHGVIPNSSFFVYLLRSGCGFIESLKQFSDARSWVFKNKYRFRIDAKYLVENWGKI